MEEMTDEKSTASSEIEFLRQESFNFEHKNENNAFSNIFTAVNSIFI